MTAAPALLGAATLAPYGAVGAGYLAGHDRRSDDARGEFHASGDAQLIGSFGIVVLAVYGIALAIAAHS
ncbi:hypothetical protein ABZ154_33070 [Streptomyces sp. NPDC006261]|uniref:hypothetical protein n=1 Tax=Streptomyces sp. NPDC006261 TaxID=3156739 RepID=UPI0033B8ED4D